MWHEFDNIVFAEHGVMFIKYCSVLLQALTIEADEDLLFAIYDLTKIKGVSWEEGTEESVYTSSI
jgi:vacuolar protein sorting-associated protein 13A/C